ncbi:MAG TPA: serine/threonine-protein kinase [Anaeromyxobacteraceae bacterium]|nr:serine/threonine-protein kinase [Anaeromyxobacteraceae bacterium]
MSIDGDIVDTLTGKTLRGVYRVQEQIADGAMGTVYKAMHTALDAPFAVKVLRQDRHPDPASIARFQREARALSRLRHPNIVAVTDFGQTEDGTLFVVMEYVAGKSLARIIADEAPLPEHRAVRIGAQILAALADAHARQVLHGALSPKDVMVESRREPPDAVKVLDFGVAGIHLGGAPVATTRAGVPLGPSPYVSPEQKSGGDIDARSDLYAVGVVLYEMLTGKLPPVPVAPPSAQLRRPVSPDLEALVMRAMKPHPYERPESAADMREELLECKIAREAAEGEDTDCGPTVVLPRQQPGSGDRSRRATPPRATPQRGTPQRAPPRSTPLQAPTPRETPSVETSAAPATPVRGAPRAAPRTPPPRTPPRPAPPRTPPPRTPPPQPTPAASRATRATTRMTVQGTRREGQAAMLSSDVIREVEKRALPLLGPVAPFLVSKAGAVATTFDELCEIVASFIPSEDDRRTFMTSTGSARRSAASTQQAARTTVAWDAALLERAQRALAAHLGPVARVLVKRLSAVARDPEHLSQLLEGEIPDEAGRAAFRRAMQSTPR